MTYEQMQDYFSKHENVIETEYFDDVSYVRTAIGWFSFTPKDTETDEMYEAYMLGSNPTAWYDN